MALNRSTLMFVMGIVLLAVGLDQVTKALVLLEFEPGEVLPVIPGLFNLTLHFNPGVAFGMFAGLDDHIRLPLLAFTTSIALGFVVYFLLTDYREDRVGQAALSLVLGGAFGNIIDRVRIGEVVDFLDFYIGTAHWPTFNVADSCICMGVGVLLVKGLRDLRSPKDAPIEEASSATTESR